MKPPAHPPTPPPSSAQGGKRRGGGGGGGRHARDDRPEKRARAEGGAPGSWDVTELASPEFEEYYKAQGVVPPEEWDAFLAALRRPLPLTFRINGSGACADALRRRLESDFLAHFTAAGADGAPPAPLEVDGEAVAPPAALAWYPGRLAWQLSVSRMQLRKLPALEALHEFMKREDATGGLTRQEAVSMVPPLFLDVQPHHRVLDLCAAPGSKTAQLLEALHAGGGGEPAGAVVANDADAARCALLTHQTARIRSPALLVVNHEAQHFPLLHDLDPASPDARVQYDRVLADVPCSGDGTMRKNPGIWRRWSPAGGNGLHLLQVRIALRAAELLRVGGRLVYSTCTFNPIEDEAVVAEVLRRAGGALELLDVSGELPGLRRTSGLRAWRVRDRAGWQESWEAARAEGYKLDRSMFPDAVSAAMPLERCMRFLPHHQDTGGFFVAVLVKTAALVGPLDGPTAAERSGGGRPGAAAGAEGAAEAAPTAEAVVAAPAAEAAPAPAEPAPAPAAAEPAPAAAPAAPAAEAAAARPARHPAKGLPAWDAAATRGGGGRNRPAGAAGAAARFQGLDPVVPYTAADTLASMRSFFGLGAACPVPDALLARTGEARPKKLAYVSAGARALLLTDAREQLKIVAAGLKMFERQEDKDGILGCCYRVAQEGLPCLLPHMAHQRLELGVPEFLALLAHRNMALPEAAKVHITRVAGGEAAPAGSAVADAVGAAPAAAAPAEPAAAAPAEPAAAAPAAEPAAAAPAAVPAAPAAAALAPAAPAGGAARPPPTRAFANPATEAQLVGLAYGCVVATLRDADAAALGLPLKAAATGGLAANAPLAISCWRGRGTLNVLVSKQECAQAAERVQAAAAAAGIVVAESEARAPAPTAAAAAAAAPAAATEAAAA